MNKQLERLVHLKDRGFNPKSIIDIGANIGQWYAIANDVFPNADILSIEPNPPSFDELVKINPNSKQLLLGDSNNKVVEFFVNEDDDKCTGASIYLEQTHYYSTPTVIPLTMGTLDKLNMKFDLIKIDVQGAELDVLQGGLNTLQHATFVTLELAVMRYNKGAPLINEVIQYMSAHDFMIFDIFELHYLNGALNQIDICFLNKKYNYMVEL